MRLVVFLPDGSHGVNYTWFPTWMGMNAALQAALVLDLNKRFKGTATPLDVVEEAIVDFLVKQYPNIHGLRGVLESIRAVTHQETSSQGQVQSAHRPGAPEVGAPERAEEVQQVAERVPAGHPDPTARPE